MASPSRKPTFKDYAVKPFCNGCGRKLVASKETAMDFQGYPFRAVTGPCCMPRRPVELREAA